MKKIAPSNVEEFLKKFGYFYDGVLRSIEISFDIHNGASALITLSVQDQEEAQDENWVNMVLDIQDITDIIIVEGKSSCVVLSSGLKVGFFNDEIYLDFCPYTEEPSGADDFRKSLFLFVGKRCIWSLAPYAD